MPKETTTTNKMTMKGATKETSYTHETIAQRAYYIWQQKNCPHGQDMEHWLEAEAQLKREMRRN